jgi:tetratricopeptide (TPR) repeat protein
MPPLPGLFNREVPRAAAERATGRTGMKDGEVSGYWFSRGLEFIRENPTRWALLTLRKVRAFLNGREVPINVEFDFFRGLSKALRIAFLPMGVLLPLGLLGLVRAARRGPEQSLFLLWFVVCFASVVLFFVASRYRLPVVPVLLLHAGFAIRELLTDVARPARLSASAAGLAALLLFSNADLELRLNPAYVAHSRGYTLETMQRWDDAIAWYERALAADPRLVLTHVHLARIHAGRGDAARAGEHYEAALRLAPADPGVRAEVENFREHVRAGGGS